MVAESKQGPLILNVDDFEPGRYVVTRILQRAKFRVREASTGEQALEFVAHEAPDLVLLDVNLPGLNGFEVCRRLKADPATARIPVVHVSASSQGDADKVQGLEGGADSYLTEPVEAEVLVATINAALRTRRAEEAARALASQWQCTFDAIRDGVALLDPEGRILRWNRGMEHLLGMTAAELRDRRCFKVWRKEDEPAEGFAFLRLMESRRREEMDVRRGERWFHVTVDPVIEEGELKGAVYLISDVTERNRLEEQFRQAQKFEGIGRLAGGVAHDFNNLLTSILGNTSLAISDLPPGPTRERLEDVIQAGERAAHLTQQLLAYSGQGRFVLERVGLSTLVAGLDDLLRSSLPRKVRLELDLQSGLPEVEADPRQVQQVLLNLVANAGEAIGDAVGTVRVRTFSATAPEAGVEDAAEGTYAVLEVCDSGPGMSESVKAHLFDPFFTTKFMGRGLGLAAVSGIVRGHRGYIHVESEPGRGACFRVLVPTVKPASPRARRTAAARKPGGAQPVVLVVDDEDVVRRVAKVALEMRGYTVLLAENGREAVELVRRKGADLTLILLDMVMPVMSGEEAMDEIALLAPNVPVIASSGYDEREAARRFANRPVAGFLQKPYTSRQLAEKVKAILEASAQ